MILAEIRPEYDSVRRGIDLTKAAFCKQERLVSKELFKNKLSVFVYNPLALFRMDSAGERSWKTNAAG